MERLHSRSIRSNAAAARLPRSAPPLDGMQLAPLVTGDGGRVALRKFRAIRDPDVLQMYTYVSGQTQHLHLTSVDLPASDVRQAKVRAAGYIRTHTYRDQSVLQRVEQRKPPPKTVSEGYGEVRQGGADGVFQAMQLDAASRFLDIGSGHGKVVLHAALQFGCHAHGIEYAKAKHRVATDMLRDMATVPGVDANKQRRLRRVTFECADATSGAPFDATHIYIFDTLFTPEVCIPLAKRLNSSMYEWLASTKNPKQWRTFGLRGLYAVCKTRIKTTGGEGMTFLVYRRARQTAVRAATR